MKSVNLYVSDGVLSALRSPFWVGVRDPESPGEFLDEKIAIARLAKEDRVNKFVYVVKNKMFTSERFSDPEMAFTEYLEGIEEVKETKTKQLESIRSHKVCDMLTVMKCCIIAFVRTELKTFCTTREEVEITLKSDVRSYPHIVEPYFKTGMSAKIAVNDCKKVYELCIQNEMEYMLDIVFLRASMDDRTALIHSVASEHFISEDGEDTGYDMCG